MSDMTSFIVQEFKCQKPFRHYREATFARSSSVSGAESMNATAGAVVLKRDNQLPITESIPSLSIQNRSYKADLRHHWLLLKNYV